MRSDELSFCLQGALALARDSTLAHRLIAVTLRYSPQYEILKLMAKVNDLQVQSTLPTLQVVMELDRALKKRKFASTRAQRTSPGF